MKKNILRKYIFLIYACLLISSIQIIFGPISKMILNKINNQIESSIINIRENQ